MEERVWRGSALLILLVLFASAAGISGETEKCSRAPAVDSILPPPRDSCPAPESTGDRFRSVGVIQSLLFDLSLKSL
ncbi:uncharacterized protein A4U43_C08F21330 [Asparagus officinalis]|nr:uncharacterized protein A4U43_C08F21330 [Asparagus officinalis]